MPHDSKTIIHLEHNEMFYKTVALAAILAPLLHSITDVLEWIHSGFSATQLLLSYLAFLPMTWLLLGLYLVLQPRLNVLALIGALLYGVAFTYYAFTVLFAWMEAIPDYAHMVERLGGSYALHGVLMILGGLLFAAACIRSSVLPLWALSLFVAGLLLNLLFGVFSVPDMLQTLGSWLRNLGLMAMGLVLWHRR